MNFVAGDDFDYGFKLKQEKEVESRKATELDAFGFPDEAFHMVTQLNWEDDIVWNGDDIKHKVLTKLNSKGGLASGWLPTATNRMALSTQKAAPAAPTTGKQGTTPGSKGGSKAAAPKPPPEEVPAEDVWYSIFPVENDELVFGRWESDIIWDSENMDVIPTPKILTLDANDENVILGIPDDIDPATKQAYVQQPVKVKIPHPHVRKSKLLLGKAGVINVLEDDSPPPPSESNDKDPYNISNDEYYAAKATEAAIKGEFRVEVALNWS
jgi:transcription initiation factor TFIID subunit 1